MPPSTLPRNIALIGFMGAGKTTVGRALARRLGWEFADTDDHLIAVAGGGRTVTQLFAEEGETRFREREAAAIRAACAREGQIIATGGGAALRDENVHALRESALVVWLAVRPESVVARTRHAAATRPILAGALSAEMNDDEREAALLAQVLGLVAARGPHYQRAAHLIVDASDRSPDTLAAEIARKAEKWSRDASAASVAEEAREPETAA